jgi:hypothetical protein
MKTELSRLGALSFVIQLWAKFKAQLKVNSQKMEATRGL